MSGAGRSPFRGTSPRGSRPAFPSSLVLLRHGTAGTRHDWDGDDAERPLDDRGRRQAAAMPTWLQEAGVTVRSLLCSPMTRCIDTLVPVAEAHAISIVSDDRLAEIEVPASSDDGWPNAAWLGTRALAALDDHVAPDDGVDHVDPVAPVDRVGRAAGALVVCSHGEILSALLAAFAGRLGGGLPDDLDLTRKRMPKGGAWVCRRPEVPTPGSELAVTELPPPC